MNKIPRQFNFLWVSLLLLAGCSTLPLPAQESALNAYKELQHTKLDQNTYAEFLSLANTINAAELKYLSGERETAELLYNLALVKGEILRERMEHEEDEVATPTDLNVYASVNHAPILQIAPPPSQTQSLSSIVMPIALPPKQQKKNKDTNATVLLNKRNQKGYYIEVSLEKCLLTLYSRDPDKKLFPIKTYRVATVSNGIKVHAIGKGQVTRIEINPVWYPTQNTRNSLLKKGKVLPSAVPPGSPSNAMGTFKIHLSHHTTLGSVYRIHGNNNKSSIGKRATRGCIRMDNDEGLKLARIIPVGTEVNIIP